MATQRQLSDQTQLGHRTPLGLQALARTENMQTSSDMTTASEYLCFGIVPPIGEVLMDCHSAICSPSYPKEGGQ
jgi:hypothetical protein